MENIQDLPNVDKWPDRKEPQERFSQRINTAMEKMQGMVDNLNNDFIPKVNEFNTGMTDRIKKQVMYLEELPAEAPENLAEGGLIIIPTQS